MWLQARHAELRAEYAKPWLEWVVSVLYTSALDIKRLQVAPAGEVDDIIEFSPCLRAMRDVHFAKLLEKLLRFVSTLKVPPPLNPDLHVFRVTGLFFAAQVLQRCAKRVRRAC